MTGEEQEPVPREALDDPVEVPEADEPVAGWTPRMPRVATPVRKSFAANVVVEGEIAQGNYALHITQVPEWQPPAYLRTDMDVVDVPGMPRPPYLQTFADPTFGARVTRVSGDPGTRIGSIAGATWGTEARHHYNFSQAWNADQSLLFLEQNSGEGASSRGVFLDGETYEPRFMQVNRPSGADIRWHPIDPTLFYYAHRGLIGVWNPQSGEARVVRDFGAQYSGMTMGPWQGQFSENGDVIALTCMKGGARVVFRYQVSTDDKGPDLEATRFSQGRPFSTARISARGQHIVWTFSPQTVEITDPNGNVVNSIATSRVSHGDLTIDENGSEVIVGRVASSATGDGPSGRIAKFRLSDGVRTGLTHGGWCSHTSTREVGRRWAVADAFDRRPQANTRPYDGELLLIALDASNVYRLCHHHNSLTPDYDSQVHPSLSPDAGRVIFASSWGAAGTTPRPVGAYVVDYRR